METRCRVTPGGGDPRESATESKPPATLAQRVRVKGWGKSPPRSRQRERHGKPHREQDRIGVTWAQAQPVSRFVARVGRARRPVTDVQDEWSSRGGSPPPYRTRLIGRLAFLAFSSTSPVPAAPRAAALGMRCLTLPRPRRFLSRAHLDGKSLPWAQVPP